MLGFLHDTLLRCDRRGKVNGVAAQTLGLAALAAASSMSGLVPVVSAASAQVLEGAPPVPTPASLMRRVSASCSGDVARFCPELSGTASPQNQLICLRPYKSDISLGCRGAVKAATH